MLTKKRNLMHLFSPQRIGEEEETEFYVKLCFDVVMEVFSCGNRRQLTKIERVGSRFHRIVENFFEKKPFVNLRLELNPWFLSFKLWERPEIMNTLCLAFSGPPLPPITHP